MPIFDNCLRRATAVDKEVIITGDLNCDLLPKRITESDCKQLKALLRQETLLKVARLDFLGLIPPNFEQ